MTGPADRDAHPDVIEISDLTEDLLTPERAAEVRSHMASCPACAEVLASLQEIQGLLGALPPAEPMPADVVARIDSALAAEQRDAVTSFDAAADPGSPQLSSTPGDVPRGTSPGTAERPHPDVPRGTSAPAGRPPAPTGPGRTRRRLRGLRIAAASSAAVLALGWGTYQLTHHTGSRTMTADSSSGRGKAGAPAASDLVGEQVSRLMSGTGSAKADGGADSPLLTPRNDATVTAPDGTVTAVPACVLQATQRTQSPLAAQRESYQGVDSYLVVLPDPADTARVDAFVVTASCSATSPGRVLFQNSYPRG